MDLTLPLDYAAIERILPHRYPFLLVDRITEFEVDKRIVGIKNVSLNERYLWHGGSGSPVLRSQTQTVSRWLLIPTACSSPGLSPASAIASPATAFVTSQISFASCSTQPGLGKCWPNSR